MSQNESQLQEEQVQTNMRVLNNEIDITKTFNIQKKDIDGALTYIKIQVKDVNGK